MLASWFSGTNSVERVRLAGLLKVMRVPENQRQEVDNRERLNIGQIDETQSHCLHTHEHLDDDGQATSVHPVGDCPGIQTQEQQRRELACGDDPQLETLPAQLVNEQHDGGGLRPHANSRHGQASEEDPDVGLAERPQRVGVVRHHPGTKRRDRAVGSPLTKTAAKSPTAIAPYMPAGTPRPDTMPRARSTGKPTTADVTPPNKIPTESPKVVAHGKRFLR